MNRPVRHIILYGSLRPGQPAFRDLGLDRDLRRVGRIRFSGTMIDLGDYPGVVLGGSDQVVGELFEVTGADVLERLDAYEDYDPRDTTVFDPETGAGSLYIRRAVTTPGGVAAFVYEYNGQRSGERSPSPAIAHGDWLRWLQDRPTGGARRA